MTVPHELEPLLTPCQMLPRMQSWPCPLNLTEWAHKYSWGSWKVLVAQLCPTLCDPMDYGSSVHEILQARILEWVAIPFSKGSYQILNPGLCHQGSWNQTLFLRFFPDLESLHLKVKASSLPCMGRFKIATWFFKTAVSESGMHILMVNTYVWREWQTEKSAYRDYLGRRWIRGAICSAS